MRNLDEDNITCAATGIHENAPNGRLREGMTGLVQPAWAGGRPND